METYFHTQNKGIKECNIHFEEIKQIINNNEVEGVSDLCETCGHVKLSHGHSGYSDAPDDLGKGECRTCEGNDDLEEQCEKFKPKETGKK